MDRKLEVVSRAGDLDALHRLLQVDGLLLDQLRATTPCIANNPLHIAALLGHADFTREVLQLKPGLAHDSNGQGLTPLHLASATGHLTVVKELISVTGGLDLCVVRDRDGLMPIQTAAAKGRLQVLTALVQVLLESARELTSQRETNFYLAVKSGCFEVIGCLLDTLGGDDISLLNLKDERGDTILHLAASKRQHQCQQIVHSTKWLLATRDGFSLKRKLELENSAAHTPLQDCSQHLNGKNWSTRISSSSTLLHDCPSPLS